MNTKTHRELATAINKEGQNKHGRPENKESHIQIAGGKKCQPTSLYPIKIAFKSNSEINDNQEKKRKTISELK